VLISGIGGFLPAVKQIANVAALPGIVGVRKLKNNYLVEITSGLIKGCGLSSLGIIYCKVKLFGLKIKLRWSLKRRDYCIVKSSMHVY